MDYNNSSALRDLCMLADKASLGLSLLAVGRIERGLLTCGMEFCKMLRGALMSDDSENRSAGTVKKLFLTQNKETCAKFDIAKITADIDECQAVFELGSI